jgi:hypothetical protein
VVLPDFPCGHTISVLRLSDRSLVNSLFMSASFNSFVFDFGSSGFPVATNQAFSAKIAQL